MERGKEEGEGYRLWVWGLIDSGNCVVSNSLHPIHAYTHTYLQRIVRVIDFVGNGVDTNRVCLLTSVEAEQNITGVYHALFPSGAFFTFGEGEDRRGLFGTSAVMLFY